MSGTNEALSEVDAPKADAPVADAPEATPAAPPASDYKWPTDLTPEQQSVLDKKKFPNVGAALDSYAGLEKILGGPREKLITVPDSKDDKGLDMAFAKLGRPTNPADYGLKGGEGQEEAVNQLAAIMHKHRLTHDQASGFYNDMVAHEKTSAQALAEGREKASTAEISELKGEWGSKWESNLSVAQQAARAFDLSGESIEKLDSALGVRKTMEFLFNIGSRMGEAPFRGGNSPSSARTPESAQARIGELKQDIGFGRKLQEGDASALKEWNRLHEQGYPDEQSKSVREMSPSELSAHNDALNAGKLQRIFEQRKLNQEKK